MTTEVMVTNLGGKGVLASGLKYSSVSWDKSIDDFGEATVRIPAQCVPNALIGAHPFVHELRIEVNGELAFVGPILRSAVPLKDSADLIIEARDMAFWLTIRFARRARTYEGAPLEIIVREIIQQALRLDDPNLWRYITVHASDIIHSRKVESRYDNAWDDHLKSIVGKLMHMRAHGRSVDFWERGTYLGELPRVRADQFSNFNNLVYDGQKYGTHSAVFGAEAIEAIEPDPDIEGDLGTPAVPAVFGIAQAARASQFRKTRVERTLRDSSYEDAVSACTAAHSLIAPRAPLGFGSTDQFRAETNCDTPWPITRVAPGMYVQLGTPLGEIGMQVRNVSGTVDSNGIETFFIGFEEVTEYTPCKALPKEEEISLPPPPTDCEFEMTVAADLRDGTWQSSRLSGDDSRIITDGNYAYFGTRAGFVVIDISDPTNPSIAGNISNTLLEDIQFGILKEGDYVYVGTGRNGGLFHVIDVSSPMSPSILATVDNPATTAHRSEMVKVGDYIFGVDVGTSSAYAIDVSNPAAPVYTDVWSDATNGNAYVLYNEFGIVVEDGFMYVSSFTGLVILNVADPSNIQLHGYLDLEVLMPYGFQGTYGDIRKQGDYVYLGGDTGQVFISINVSNPSTPVLADFIDDGRLYLHSYTILIEDSIAYIWGEVDMLSIDISDPSNMAILGSVATTPTSFYPGMAYDAIRYNDYILFPNGYASESLAAVNTSDPSNLVFTELPIPTDNPHGREFIGLAVQGDYAYLKGLALENDCFVSVSLCAQPETENFGMEFVDVTYTVGQQFSHASDRPGLCVSNDVNTYVVWGYRHDEDTGLTAYGVMTAETVNGVSSVVGFLPISGTHPFKEYNPPVMVGPNHVAMVLAEFVGGVSTHYLRIFDISDPANVVQSAKLTSLPMADSSHTFVNLASYGSRLFMFPYGTGNWREVDCSDPTNPVAVRSGANLTNWRSQNELSVRGQSMLVQTPLNVASRVMKSNLFVPSGLIGFGNVTENSEPIIAANDSASSFAYVSETTSEISVISGNFDTNANLVSLGNGRLRNVPGGRGFVQIGTTMTRRWIFTDNTWSTIEEIIDTPIVGDPDSLSPDELSNINANGVGYCTTWQNDLGVDEGFASWIVKGLNP